MVRRIKSFKISVLPTLYDSFLFFHTTILPLSLLSFPFFSLTLSFLSSYNLYDRTFPRRRRFIRIQNTTTAHFIQTMQIPHQKRLFLIIRENYNTHPTYYLETYFFTSTNLFINFPNLSSTTMDNDLHN